ncbi:hypothetical protein AVEN_123219-1 [Araneus ventricosus]|uniref:Galectin n=1 Tax=Araneus ventricosus TaxID=182803 RepID=A0A4Y2BX67_ARAVE|nr:hypothetical protein AVEN_123219-1 [Araneus ventricosus]
MTEFDLSADRALHLGIRFDQHCVVRNHKQYDQWGPEERQGPFPFSFGREFTMLIAAERTQYRIAVNNQHCWDFGHRLPMDRVNSIAVRGFCDVHQIEFIDRPNPVRARERKHVIAASHVRKGPFSHEGHESDAHFHDRGKRTSLIEWRRQDKPIALNGTTVKPL